LDKAGEFVLISFLVGVKLEDSFLQNVQKAVDAMIVSFLLLAGGKS
jgi:hypothetical protein